MVKREQDEAYRLSLEADRRKVCTLAGNLKALVSLTSLPDGLGYTPPPRHSVTEEGSGGGGGRAESAGAGAHGARTGARGEPVVGKPSGLRGGSR